MKKENLAELPEPFFDSVEGYITYRQRKEYFRLFRCEAASDLTEAEAGRAIRQGQIMKGGIMRQFYDASIKVDGKYPLTYSRRLNEDENNNSEF